MFVCLCRAVSERKVRAAVLSGVDTVEKLANACGAGADCGSCHPSLRALIGERCAMPPTHAVGSGDQGTAHP